MKAKITNNSKANQGIWTDDGLQTVEPGGTRTLTIADDYVARAKSLPFLKVVGVGSDALDHDGDGKAGGVVDASPLTAAEEAELIDAMTDDELHAFIERKTGSKAHPMTGHDKLLAKAREAAEAGA